VGSTRASGDGRAVVRLALVALMALLLMAITAGKLAGTAATSFVHTPMMEHEK
jgi:hypothetical protein